MLDLMGKEELENFLSKKYPYQISMYILEKKKKKEKKKRERKSLGIVGAN